MRKNKTKVRDILIKQARDEHNKNLGVTIVSTLFNIFFALCLITLMFYTIVPITIRIGVFIVGCFGMVQLVQQFGIIGRGKA